MIGRAGDDAGVEMIDDAGQRPAPAGIADIGNVVALPAQPSGKQRGLHLMTAKAVEEDADSDYEEDDEDDEEEEEEEEPMKVVKAKANK